MSIKWNDLYKYSLVLVEFGNPKDKLDIDNDKTYTHGINLGHEFCYKHMAIVVSNKVKDVNTISVIPLTSYKDEDENYKTNIIVDIGKYQNIVDKKTTIKTSLLTHIDKKIRIKKIIKPYISKLLQKEIGKAMEESFGVCPPRGLAKD